MTNNKLSLKVKSMIDLISKGWCQRSSARNAKNLEVPYKSEAATSFCIIGAAAKVTQGSWHDEGQRIVAGLSDKLREKTKSFISLENWNDNPDRKKEDVINFLQEVQKDLEAQEANG